MFLTKDGPNQYRLVFPLLIYALPLPFCEALTVQSGTSVEENTSDFIVSTHYGPLT